MTGRLLGKWCMLIIYSWAKNQTTSLCCWICCVLPLDEYLISVAAITITLSGGVTCFRGSKGLMNTQFVNNQLSDCPPSSWGWGGTFSKQSTSQIFWLLPWKPHVYMSIYDTTVTIDLILGKPTKTWNDRISLDDLITWSSINTTDDQNTQAFGKLERCFSS